MTTSQEKVKTFKDLQALSEINKKSYARDTSGSPHQYNNYQNFLYRRALFGLKYRGYTKSKLEQLGPQKIEAIKRHHRKAQNILNLWKQEKVIELSNKLFGLFHKSSLAEEIIDLYSDPDPN